MLTGAAALAAAGWAAPAYCADDDLGDGTATAGSRQRVRLTVLGTTDLHGNVFNWDYYKNAEYDDSAHNDIGLAKVATLVKAVRKELRKRQRPVAAARRRRHHPGHPAGLLLRRDRADHRRRRCTRWRPR